MSNAPSDDKPDEIVVTIVGGDEREPLLGHHATGNGHPSLANATRAVMAAQSISRSPSSFERMASLTRSLSDSRSGVLRRAAASWVAGAEETFMCQICLCHERLRDSCEVTPCKHLFCTCCLLEYVNGQISDGITDIQCPSIEEESSQRCQVVLTDDQVLALLQDPKMIRKFQKFRASHRDRNYRECPRCDHLQVGDPAAPQMTCAACGARYCFVHSTAHPPDEPCAAYEARTGGAIAATRRVLEATTKPCPQCHAPSHKFTGCNHMKCPRCAADWCWLCGEAIEVGEMFPPHYDATNLASPCAGQQFTGGGAGWCGALLQIPFLVLAVPVFVALTLLIALLNPMRLCRGGRLWFRWATVRAIAGLLFVLVALVVALVVGALVVAVGCVVCCPVLCCVECCSSGGDGDEAEEEAPATGTTS